MKGAQRRARHLFNLAEYYQKHRFVSHNQRCGGFFVSHPIGSDGMSPCRHTLSVQLIRFKRGVSLLSHT